MFKRAEEVTLKITDYAFGGKGIAKVPAEGGEYVVFVDNTFPGQTVLCRIVKKKKRYAEAKLLDVLERSPFEQLSDFQEISGGPYIYVPVEKQEEVKKKSTLEVFRRIGGIIWVRGNNSV